MFFIGMIFKYFMKINIFNIVQKKKKEKRCEHIYGRYFCYLFNVNNRGVNKASENMYELIEEQRRCENKISLTIIIRKLQ